MLFINNAKYMVRLGYWNDVDYYREITVKSNTTVNVPVSETNEWYICAENYSYEGKFSLNPVWNDKTGYCSEGVTRSEDNGCFVWIFI